VLRDAVREHFGDLAAGRTMQSLQVRYLNALTNTAIVRVARDDHRALGTAMAMVTALRGRPVILRTAHLGGTIRCCQKAAVALQRQKMDELRLQLAAAAAAVAPDAAAEPDAASVAALGGVLIGSSARSNQSGVARNAQQTLRQLSALLSQYQGARAAQAAAASTHAAPATIPALAAQLARGEQAVLATPQAIARAIDQAAAAAEDEIAAMEV
jgi:RNase P/RNase MRP subunit POP5